MPVSGVASEMTAKVIDLAEHTLDSNSSAITYKHIQCRRYL